MKPYFEDSHSRLYQGDSRVVLAALPAESIDCTITSPPYWSLRAYAGIEPLLFGGREDCEHEFDTRVQKGQSAGGFGSSSLHGVESPVYRATLEAYKVPTTESATCRLCGCWRGHYGLEPDPSSYIAHSMEYLDAIWRVLKPSGTVFWNLGDSWVGSGGNHKAHHKNDTGFQGKGAELRGGTGAKVTKHDYAEAHKSGAGTPISAGLKPKDMALIPFRFAIAAQERGWWVRSVIIWNKPNPMPESVHGSYYYRHRVTIEEYENMSNLQRTKGSDGNRSTDLSGVQESQIPNSEGALYTEREGQGDSESAGGTGGRKGEETPVQPVAAGTRESEEVCNDRERAHNSEEGESYLSSIESRPTESPRTISTNQRQPDTDSAEVPSRLSLSANTERTSETIQGLREAQGGDSEGSSLHGGTVVRDSSPTQEPLSLLWEEEDTNDRSRDSSEQRRLTPTGEHRAGLPIMQRGEEGQTDKAFIDCPGCSKCAPTGGYILSLSAGRPTDAHEYIFLLTKSARYYWNAEAIREPSTTPIGHKWDLSTTKTFGGESQIAGRANRDGREFINIDGGRNSRSVWTFPTKGYSEAHFATYPEELPRRCIAAGTSEKGVCPDCGAPWVQESERIVTVPLVDASYNAESTDGVVLGNNGGKGSTLRGQQDKVSRLAGGWHPTCKHTSEPVPATVLDPFAGSSTTLLVAKKMGRHAIGVELSPEYCALSLDRIRQGALAL